VTVQGKLEIDFHVPIFTGITGFEGATRIIERLRDAAATGPGKPALPQLRDKEFLAGGTQ